MQHMTYVWCSYEALCRVIIGHVVPQCAIQSPYNMPHMRHLFLFPHPRFLFFFFFILLSFFLSSKQTKKKAQSNRENKQCVVECGMLHADYDIWCCSYEACCRVIIGTCCGTMFHISTLQHASYEVVSCVCLCLFCCCCVVFFCWKATTKNTKTQTQRANAINGCWMRHVSCRLWQMLMFIWGMS